MQILKTERKKMKIPDETAKVMLILQKFWFSGDIILFPVNYNKGVSKKISDLKDRTQ